MENIDAYANLPLGTHHLVFQAYDFARQSEQTELFQQEFEKTLNDGTTSQWANVIIKHFRDDAKGGGNYRVLDKAREASRKLVGSATW